MYVNTKKSGFKFNFIMALFWLIISLLFSDLIIPVPSYAMDVAPLLCFFSGFLTFVLILWNIILWNRASDVGWYEDYEDNEVEQKQDLDK